MNDKASHGPNVYVSNCCRERPPRRRLKLGYLATNHVWGLHHLPILHIDLLPADSPCTVLRIQELRFVPLEYILVERIRQRVLQALDGRNE